MARTRFNRKQLLGFLSNRQNDTSNNADPADQRIEFGWGYIPGNNANSIAETVSFRQAFNSPPVVLMSTLGYRLISAGTPTSPGDFDPDAGFYGAAGFVTTTNFKLEFLQREASGSLGNVANYGYSWIAIGN